MVRTSRRRKSQAPGNHRGEAGDTLGVAGRAPVLRFQRHRQRLDGAEVAVLHFLLRFLQLPQGIVQLDVPLLEVQQEPLVGPAHGRLPQKRGHGELHVLGLPGLGDVPVQTGVVEGIDRLLEARPVGDQDLDHSRELAVEDLQEAGPGNPRERLVGDHHVQLLSVIPDPVENAEPFLGGTGLEDFLLGPDGLGDQTEKEIQGLGVVVDQNDAALAQSPPRTLDSDAVEYRGPEAPTARQTPGKPGSGH